MHRRKILFLSQRVPYPPDKGDKIRSYHQVEYLAARHDLYCAFFVEDENDRRHADALRERCRDVIVIPWRPNRARWRAAGAWACGQSMACAAYGDPAMRAALREIENHSFDVVSAYSSSMATYAMQIPAGRRVLDLCDADSQKWMDYAERSGPIARRFYRAEGRRLRAHEQHCMECFDETIVITPRERLVLDPAGEERHLHVIPNGAPSPPEGGKAASQNGPVVAFFGSMNYRPNVEAVEWFSRKVWPRVRQHQAVARFLIVGREPTARVRRLSRISGVEVIGEVADVGATLQAARVVVAPLRIARGLPNKLLEAMAYGRAVVATSAAASCVSAVPGREIIVADEAGDFAGKVVQLLTSEALCDRVARAGRVRARTDYDWSRILQRYEQVLLGEELCRPVRRVQRSRIEPTTRLCSSPLVCGALGSFRAGKVC